MTFDEARNRIDKAMDRAVNGMSDGSEIVWGLNEMRQAMFEVIRVMRDLVDTIEQETRR